MDIKVIGKDIKVKRSNNLPNQILTIKKRQEPYQSISTNEIVSIPKTVFDKIGALVGIIIASPLALLIALAIKLGDGGPIFFKQVRSGMNGRPFIFYKFRTMNVNAESQKNELLSLNEMSGPAFKITDDPRVTLVGKFLRKTSMDELPQFYNVIKGDMSLVGPRPPLPSEVKQYKEWQYRRLSVKPGITCLWQINGRNDIDFDKWMKLDLQYIDNWSFWTDIKIILKTIPAILRCNGAS